MSDTSPKAHIRVRIKGTTGKIVTVWTDRLPEVEGDQLVFKKGGEVITSFTHSEVSSWSRIKGRDDLEKEA